MMKARCPKCGRKLAFSEGAIGRRGRCGACGQVLAVLRPGKLYCLETEAAGETVIAASKTIIDEEPGPALPLRPPIPKKFKLGDCLRLYQPWVVLLAFSGLVGALVSAPAVWRTWQRPATPPADPAHLDAAVAASPAAPEVPSSPAPTSNAPAWQSMTLPATRPSPSSSPAP